VGGEVAKIRVQMELKVPIEISKKGKWYIASCPVLDICSQGKTERSAKNNLSEALGLFLTTCFEMGTLEDVLKTCGFEISPSSKNPQMTKPLPTRAKDYVNIPLHLLVNQSGINNCHA
jgi:predicted RNase H-like HicB family nuclease